MFKSLRILTFCLLIYGVSCGSLQQAFPREKRWDDPANTNVFRGTAGVDYPDLKEIPVTRFRCEDQVYEGGLYADVETQCQVYHVCHDGRKDSFLCGKGTIFNQQILACDYWYSADCNTAPNFYYMNAQIGNSVSSQPSHQEQTNNNQNPQTSHSQYWQPQGHNGQHSQNGRSQYDQSPSVSNQPSQNLPPQYSQSLPGGSQYAKNKPSQYEQTQSSNSQYPQNENPQYGFDQNINNPFPQYPQVAPSQHRQLHDQYDSNAESTQYASNGYSQSNSGYQQPNVNSQAYGTHQPSQDTNVFLPNNANNDKMTCRCLRSVLKAPWSFPSN